MLPNATTPGSGSLSGGRTTTRFSAVEAVGIENFASYAVLASAGHDELVIDVPGTNDGNGRVQGDSGGTAFAPLAYAHLPRLVIYTMAHGTTGPDLVTVRGTDAGGAGPTLVAVQVGTGAAHVAAEGGTVVLEPVFVADGGTASLSASGDAVVEMRAGTHTLTMLDIAEDATVRLAAGGVTQLLTGALRFGVAGVLDLRDNAVRLPGGRGVDRGTRGFRS